MQNMCICKKMYKRNVLKLQILVYKLAKIAFIRRWRFNINYPVVMHTLEELLVEEKSGAWAWCVSTHDNKEALHTFCTGPFSSSSFFSNYVLGSISGLHIHVCVYIYVCVPCVYGPHMACTHHAYMHIANSCKSMQMVTHRLVLLICICARQLLMCMES